MNINHHADDSTLLSHAAAALPQSFSLIVAAHLEQCDRCRQRLQEAENIGGALINGLEATPIEAGSIDAVWAAIESGSPEPLEEGTIPAGFARNTVMSVADTVIEAGDTCRLTLDRTGGPR